MESTIFETNGLRLIQKTGPYLELFFNWQKLPTIDLEQEYYMVRIIPQSACLPIEYARPNSEGPLHFCLKENVDYRLELLRSPHLKYEVESELQPFPHVDLVLEQENFVKLTWGNLDVAGICQELDQDRLELWADDKLLDTRHKYEEHFFEIDRRVERLSLWVQPGKKLFEVKCNLKGFQKVTELSFKLDSAPMRLHLSKVVTPEDFWKLRAEFPMLFETDMIWQSLFQKQFPKSREPKLEGCLRILEDDKQTKEIRLFGYHLRLNHKVIDKIQTEEWQLDHPKPIEQIKIQLQITSAHRELFKWVAVEKEIDYDQKLDLVGFAEKEIKEAKANLFQKNQHVNWDQSLIEIVAWFCCAGYPEQEFDRKIAHCSKWEIVPDRTTDSCRAQWVLKDMSLSGQQVKVMESGRSSREHFPPKVSLKPFGSAQIAVCWDLEYEGVSSFIWREWKSGLEDVGFYLKIHEEHLGNRTHRADMDCHIVDLFTVHQNIYLNVEPNRCFSAEIVARKEDRELALTPVSSSIVTPRTGPFDQLPDPPHMSLGREWHHCTQKEVRHLHGSDQNNQAKVLLHFHMHSPNLIRVDPFREGFLRNQPWPFKTSWGSEVHNPPGEWALKNCLDSWLPLLRAFRTLRNDGVDYQVSLDITPPVAYLISCPRFKDYLSRYLLRLRARIQSQIALMRSRLDPPGFIWAGQRYLEDVEAIDRFYNHEIQKDMIGAYRELELQGFLELSTCTATHGMPAVMESTPDSLDAQIAIAARSHHRIFGDRPRGIWLAENSYFPGVEKYLAKEALYYFFVEAEAVLWGSHQLAQEEFNPLMTPIEGLTAFGRSRMGRVQVWDAEHGYAGHPDFKEYHHRHLGLPLKRITSKTSEDKAPYNPDQAAEVAKSFGRDFHHKLSEKAHQLSHGNHPSIPLITCTYDAELFGHHWSEGVIFLEELLREFYRKSDAIGLTTPSHHLAGRPTFCEATPNPSTWGHESVHVRWTDPKVIWTQKELDRADGILREYLARAIKGDFDEFQKQLIEQMGAELLRAQSSDLTFVIMSGDFEEDMRREIQKYLDYFYRLKHLIDNKIRDDAFLDFRMYENGMFYEFPDYYKIR